MNRHQFTPYPRAMRGFTLVELMVAMVLGLMLLGALVTLVVSTSTNRSELDKSARQIENGRYALQVLAQDIEMAGFFGAVNRSPSWQPVVPDACPATVAPTAPAATPPVNGMGYNASGATPVLPMAIVPLTAIPNCPNAIATQANTGILQISRVSSQIAATPVAGEAYVQMSMCGTQTKPMSSGQYGTAAFDRTQKDCTTAAPLRQAAQRIYFISPQCSNCSASDTPTLTVAEYSASSGKMTLTPLVEGIENMQFQFGMDVDADGAPDCYVSDPSVTAAPTQCPAAAAPFNWSDGIKNYAHIVSVRINLLARNTEPTPGWKDSRTYDLGTGSIPAAKNDAYKRHLYSTVARVVNPSSVLEQP